MMKTQLKEKPHTKAKRGISVSEKSKKISGRRSSPIGTQKSGSSQSEERAKKKGQLPDTVEEFDRRFDDGESLSDLGIDLSKATRPGLEIKRITLDIPAHMLDKLDHYSAFRGIARQALIKTWLFERIEKERENTGNH
jgi:hypothetical protein